MEKVLMCRDLGIDCACCYEARGGTAFDVLELIMKHIHADHEMDWFEIEEIRETALACVRDRAA